MQATPAATPHTSSKQESGLYKAKVSQLCSRLENRYGRDSSIEGSNPSHCEGLGGGATGMCGAVHPTMRTTTRHPW